MKNKNVLLQESNFHNFYITNKLIVFPIAVIAICIIVFINFIIPQIQLWADLNNRVNDESQKLTIMKKNFNTVSLNDENALTTKLQTVTAAAPATKDYIGILSSVSHASIESGVSLGDYSFQLGKINDSEKNVTQITLSLTTSIDRLKTFLINLKKQLPLSTITTVSMETNTSAIVVVQFFSKPFSKYALNYDVPLSGLSPGDEDTINKFSTYEKPEAVSIVNIASSSGGVQ